MPNISANSTIMKPEKKAAWLEGGKLAQPLVVLDRSHCVVAEVVLAGWNKRKQQFHARKHLPKNLFPFEHLQRGTTRCYPSLGEHRISAAVIRARGLGNAPRTAVAADETKEMPGAANIALRAVPQFIF